MARGAVPLDLGNNELDKRTVLLSQCKGSNGARGPFFCLKSRVKGYGQEMVFLQFGRN